MKNRVIILDSCLKEMKKFPLELHRDLLTVIGQLNDGVKFSLPLSRPMPSIGNSVHELRLKDRSGQYRIIYLYKNSSGAIYFIHAFMKKTRTTPKKNINLARKRIGRL